VWGITEATQTRLSSLKETFLSYCSSLSPLILSLFLRLGFLDNLILLRQIYYFGRLRLECHILDPEVRGSTLLRNVGKLLPELHGVQSLRPTFYQHCQHGGKATCSATLAPFTVLC
jgi:hypothetical protein